MRSKVKSLTDIRQKFWQLAMIQGSSMGLPVLVSGSLFSKSNSLGTIITSIIIGNMILWVIGLVMVLMTSKHESALQNVSNYLGKKTMYAAGIVFALAFIGWYGIQISSAVEYFVYVKELSDAQKLKIGLALGAFTALLSMGGIRLIKWIACLCFFPFVAFFIFLLIKFQNSSFSMLMDWEPRLKIVLTVVFSLLPGVINLPTFFRHAQSKAHAVGGLSMTIFIYCIFETLFVFLGIDSIRDFSTTLQNPLLLTFFLVLSLICTNLLNIYFASATWEVALSHYSGAKGNAISGLIGTLLFCVLQGEKPMLIVNTIFNSFIASLGVVLLIMFSIRSLVFHRSRAYEKKVGTLSWWVGCICSFLMVMFNPSSGLKAVSWGMAASLLSFILVAFFEETTWSIKALLKKKR